MSTNKTSANDRTSQDDVCDSDLAPLLPTTSCPRHPRPRLLCICVSIPGDTHVHRIRRIGSRLHDLRTELPNLEVLVRRAEVLERKDLVDDGLQARVDQQDEVFEPARRVRISGVRGGRRVEEMETYTVCVSR